VIALSSDTLEAIMGKVVRLPIEGGGMINHKRRPVLDLFSALRSQALQILQSLASVLWARLEQDTLRKRLVEVEQQRAQRALDTLLSIAELLIANNTPPNEVQSNQETSKLIHQLLTLVSRVLNCESALLVSFEAATEVVDFIAATGLSREQEQQWQQRLMGQSLRELCTDPALPTRLMRGEDVLLEVSKSRYSVYVPDPQNFRTLLVPLRQGASLLGLLCLNQHAPMIFNERERVLARGAAKLAVLILERERLVRERAEAQTQVHLAAVQERERLARELHDSVLQALFGISLEAQLAEEEQEVDQEQWRSVLERIISLAEGGQAEMRALLFELRPESMESEGLIGALLKLVAMQRTRHALVVETELDEEKEPALSLESKHALYRIAQEAFHNIVKHAHASRVVLRLDSDEREVVMVIQDNGRGFEPRASFPGHLGLRSMRERVASLHGEILIESSPGQGTTLTIRVPTTTTS
jgi:signal transduction histidine kinase